MGTTTTKACNGNKRYDAESFVALFAISGITPGCDSTWHKYWCKDKFMSRVPKMCGRWIGRRVSTSSLPSSRDAEYLWYCGQRRGQKLEVCRHCSAHWQLGRVWLVISRIIRGIVLGSLTYFASPVNLNIVRKWGGTFGPLERFNLSTGSDPPPPLGPPSLPPSLSSLPPAPGSLPPSVG